MKNNGRIKALYYAIGIFLLTLILIGSGLLLWSKYKDYTTRKTIQSIYESQAAPLMPQAIEKLKTDANDWLVCTDLGLSLDDINSPKVMASWVAYYAFGKTYCEKWWEWPENPCEFLKDQRGHVDDTEQLEKKIALCTIASQYKPATQ